LRRLTEAAAARPVASAPVAPPRPASRQVQTPAASGPAPVSRVEAPTPPAPAVAAPVAAATPDPVPALPAAPASDIDGGGIERLVEALRKSTRTFFGTALARATFVLEGSRLLLAVGGNFEQTRCEGRRSWIEDTAQQVFGRKVPLEIRVVIQAADAAVDPVESDKARLKEQALKSEAVQAMLDVFAADIRDAEEIP
jgi:hypothetical protein